ncbi:MAG: hypothetical protein ACR2HQ_00260 [Ilumatobacteraceae bacterium]
MTRRTTRVELALWVGAVAVVVVSVIWGRDFERRVPAINLGAAPLVGRDPLDGWDWRFGWSLVGAAAVAAAVVVAVARGWWWRVRLRWVVVTSSIGAAGFAVLLALTDGADGVLRGAAHETEYLVNLPVTPPAAEFVRTFVDRISDYSVHVRGHPPGFVLVLKLLDAVHLGGQWAAATLSIAATAAAPAGVLVAVWAVAGASWVRRAAPVLIVAPYAVWMVTSADAVYTAVGAWGVALVAISLRHRRVVRATRVVAAAAAGLLLGVLLFLTYGGAVFLAVPLVLVVADPRRAPGPALAVTGATVVGIGAVVAAFAGFGFWWFAGAAATRVEYWEGTAGLRTGGYFAVANIAAALIALGPLTLAGLIRLRDRRVWLLVAGALLALSAAHLSQYSKAEVERIWLLFFPWIAVAGGVLVAATARSATWVGVQAATTIALQAALVSKW